MREHSVARVLLDSPLPQLDRLLDYRIPSSLIAEAVPGVRVKVPLRTAGRLADGFIVGLAHVGSEGDSAYSGVLSELDSVVSTARVLTPELWALARKVADRAAGSANDVIRLAVPKRQVRVEKAWLESKRAEPEDTSIAELFDYDTAEVEATVAERGRFALDAVPQLVEVNGRWVGHWARTMAALATRAIRRGSVILCVPDYRDQEQLMVALEAVLPASRIIRLDSRQANSERYRQFLTCLDQVPRVIVGNRSAIYAPAESLCLIAVWDDGDPLHSEPLSPYVHSRDAALVRQEQQSCALAFLGHSRSVEVQRLVEIGWLSVISPVRHYQPKVIPTEQQISNDRLAIQARMPSAAWREARVALDSGPVLIQVARPGYAPQLLCGSCRKIARCRNCSGPLMQKTARSAPSCGWCGAIAAGWSCSQCSSTQLRQSGQGAERTAEDLGRAFPGIRVIIADGQRQILQVTSAPALVIATRGAEPVAAGGYRAVLLLDGERMLARESLRVAEDCIRWWANAISLAAPGAPCVLVGVGGGPATALATWRLADFASAELADRRTLRFPPAIRVATVTGPVSVVSSAVDAVSEVPSVDVLGPVEQEPGSVRAIVRMDYARAAEVARVLRAEIVRNATSRRRAPASERSTGRVRQVPLPTLRVRFDDREPFEQL